MSKIKIIHADSATQKIQADLILTDPPFDMPGATLAEIIRAQDCGHLVLITTMRQLLEFYPRLGWQIGFDFVLDAVAPKKSRSCAQPNYTHHTGVYLYKHGEKSRFNRKLRQRSDVFDGNGYWPTIFYAPKQRGDVHSLAKNVDAFTDLLGSFSDVRHVLDLFGGSGATALAAFELDIDCTIVEKDEKHAQSLKSTFRFLNG